MTPKERFKIDEVGQFKFLSKQEIQHWIDRWKRLKPSPKRGAIIKIWSSFIKNNNEL